MKKAIFPIVIAGLIVPVIFLWQKQFEQSFFTAPEYPAFPEYSDGPKQPDSGVLLQQTQKALAFCLKNNLNREAAIFIDLGLHSGYSRCWVVRLADGSIRQKGLVTHGSGKYGLKADERKYSNEEGSLLSSLGKYKIGISYNGQFGLAFKLHGLEATNSNAYKRFIVLHGHECVPDVETVDLLCQSWGCPTVSPQFLLQLQKVIISSSKPLLLWVYDSEKGH